MRVKTATAPKNLDARDQLVMEHVPLVKTLAQRLVQRLPAQVEINDLMSVGVLGLIDAASRYKPSLGVPSLYYAAGIDATGESFGPDDYEALRRTWSSWRAGLPRSLR